MLFLLLLRPLLLGFAYCFSLMGLASVYADYQRSRFYMSQSITLRTRARGCSSVLRRAFCLEGSHLYFCCLTKPSEYLEASANLFSSVLSPTPTNQFALFSHTKASLLFCIDVFLYTVNLSSSLYFFHPCGSLPLLFLSTR